MTESDEVAPRDASGDRASRDIIRNTSFLSVLIKEFVEDFSGFELEELREILGGGTYVKAIDPELYNSRFARSAMDNLFDIKLPGGTCDTAILVNVEMEKRMRNMAELVKRGAHYCSSLIADQREIGADSYYGKIKKVYSIWILGNPPPELRGRSESYSLMGKTPEAVDLWNGGLINVVVIGLRDPRTEWGPAALRYISAALYPGLTADERKRIIEETGM